MLYFVYEVILIGNSDMITKYHMFFIYKIIHCFLVSICKGFSPLNILIQDINFTMVEFVIYNDVINYSITVSSLKLRTTQNCTLPAY